MLRVPGWHHSNKVQICKIQFKFSSNEDTEHTVRHPDCISYIQTHNNKFNINHFSEFQSVSVFINFSFKCSKCP